MKALGGLVTAPSFLKRANGVTLFVFTIATAPVAPSHRCRHRYLAFRSATSRFSHAFFRTASERSQRYATENLPSSHQPTATRTTRASFPRRNHVRRNLWKLGARPALGLSALLHQTGHLTPGSVSLARSTPSCCRCCPLLLHQPPKRKRPRPPSCCTSRPATAFSCELSAAAASSMVRGSSASVSSTRGWSSGFIHSTAGYSPAPSHLYFMGTSFSPDTSAFHRDHDSEGTQL